MLTFAQFTTRFRAAQSANPGRFRAAFLGLLAIILLVTSLQYAAKVAKPAEHRSSDAVRVLRWRAMILDVFAGANPYVGKNEYPNPPVMAIILRPFAELPPIAGAMSWFFAKVLMAVLAALWTFRLVSGDAPLRRQRQGGRDPPRACRPLPATCRTTTSTSSSCSSSPGAWSSTAAAAIPLRALCSDWPSPARSRRCFSSRTSGGSGPGASWRRVSSGSSCGWRSCPARSSAGNATPTAHRLVQAHDRAARPQGRDHHRASEPGHSGIRVPPPHAQPLVHRLRADAEGRHPRSGRVPQPPRHRPARPRGWS